MTIYDRLGEGYTLRRRSDPRIAAQIREALGSAATVLNVGAGTGAYEPVEAAVVAVEPSMLMIRQRAETAAPVAQACAESLPFPDACFESGMAILTVHHWYDMSQGLKELRRVVGGTVVVLTWDTAVFDQFWMVADYVPASSALDRDLPPPETIAELLGGGIVEKVLVPADCIDGFYAAWWRRPEAYLDPTVRAAISGLARLTRDQVEPGIRRLRRDLADGTWEQRYGRLLNIENYDAGYRLVVSPS